MKKTTQPVTRSRSKKGFLSLVGEAFHVLGEEIVEGKDKVVEIASDKITAVKKTIRNFTHKKAVSVGHAGRKAVVKKVVPKKVAKKATSRVSAATKKVVKKAAAVR